MQEQTKRRIIALTGALASGKSSVAKILENHGADIIDADLLAREAIKPGSEGFKSVIETFPLVFDSEKKEIDRKKLAEIVFSSELQRKKLENIVHPTVNSLYHQKLKELIYNKKTSPILYVVPLYFESRFEYPEIDSVIVVSADKEICIKRTMKRDGISRDQAEKRFDSQICLEEKEKLADIVIYNDGDLNSLEEKVEKMLRQKKLFGNK